MSVDVTNMYNNVNVPRVVSFILEKIYEQPRKYFKYKNDNNVFLPVPTRENLKMFLLNTFQKYSIFRSPLGVYKQKQGLAMGSSISSCIANIYVYLMEKNIVKNYIESGKLVTYHRYADDVILIIRKNALRSFLKEINSYDQGLKFTLEEMNSDDEITFLDSKIYIIDGILEFTKFRRRGRLTVISNFKHSVMPMKYLKGNIFTALNRGRDACSTHEIFLNSL